MVKLSVDGYSAIVEQFGYAVGEMILRRIANLIRADLHTDDAVARWGENMISILLNNTTAKAAEGIAENLLATIHSTHTENNGRKIDFTVSARIATLGEEDFGENDETWYPGVPDHIFETIMEINSYNFKKLSGYEFNVQIIEKLVKDFPKQISDTIDNTNSLSINSDYDKVVIVGMGGSAIAGLIVFGFSFSFSGNNQKDSKIETLIKTGLNVGVPIGDNYVANVYTSYNNQLEPDSLDSDYYILGGEFSVYFTKLISATAGIKTVLGLDDFASYEGYLGAILKF